MDIYGGSMKKNYVYDLPVRVFHWLFACLFVTGFAIGKTVDDESFIFGYHSIIGLVIGLLVLLRVMWGLIGTKHARFSGFALNPKDLISYFKGILKGDLKKWAGHNPASSWAAVIMMTLALGLVTTGYLMTSGGNKKFFEEIHELFANSFVVIVVLHVAGIVLHTVRHKEMIGLSMLDGKKASVPEADVVASTKPVFAMAMLGIAVAFAIYLVNNYSLKTGALNVFGTSLQLVEVEDLEVD
jgi:cytochrome b